MKILLDSFLESKQPWRALFPPRLFPQTQYPALPSTPFNVVLLFPTLNLRMYLLKKRQIYGKTKFYLVNPPENKCLL